MTAVIEGDKLIECRDVKGEEVPARLPSFEETLARLPLREADAGCLEPEERGIRGGEWHCEGNESYDEQNMPGGGFEQPGMQISVTV